MFIRLHWWKEFNQNGLQNYGDLMSFYLVKKISKKFVVTTRNKSNRFWQKLIPKYYIAIGSIIGGASKNSIVWGGGIISRDQFVKKATFVAVRGPKTRDRLLSLGYEVPKVYGDPALLLPRFIKNKERKVTSIALIPHFVDYESVNKSQKEVDDFSVINLLTNSVVKTTKEIIECSSIVSSSLHGVIVGHAYGIPSLWVKFSNNLSGDDIKFYDYLESVGIIYPEPIFIDPSNISLKKTQQLTNRYNYLMLPAPEMIEKRQEDLLKSCPF